ncbi:outer membrane beta-barrel protein [Ekhidna sp.]
MKKKLILVIIGLGLINESYSQDKFQLGVKVGAVTSNPDKNIPDLSPNSTIEYGWGWQAGLYGSYRMSNKINSRIEIIYAINEHDDVHNFVISNGSRNREVHTLDFVNIPLIFELIVFKGIKLQAGSQVGFLMSYESKEVNFSPPTIRNFTNAHSNLDIGLLVGLGWISPIGIELDLRYVHGVSDIRDYNPEFFNRTIQFSLAYPILKF